MFINFDDAEQHILMTIQPKRPSRSLHLLQSCLFFRLRQCPTPVMIFFLTVLAYPYSSLPNHLFPFPSNTYSFKYISRPNYMIMFQHNLHNQILDFQRSFTIFYTFNVPLIIVITKASKMRHKYYASMLPLYSLKYHNYF